MTEQFPRREHEAVKLPPSQPPRGLKRNRVACSSVAVSRASLLEDSVVKEQGWEKSTRPKEATHLLQMLTISCKIPTQINFLHLSAVSYIPGKGLIHRPICTYFPCAYALHQLKDSTGHSTGL